MISDVGVDANSIKSAYKLLQRLRRGRRPVRDLHLDPSEIFISSVDNKRADLSIWHPGDLARQMLHTRQPYGELARLLMARDAATAARKQAMKASDDYAPKGPCAGRKNSRLEVETPGGSRWLFKGPSAAVAAFANRDGAPSKASSIPSALALASRGGGVVVKGYRVRSGDHSCALPYGMQEEVP